MQFFLKRFFRNISKHAFLNTINITGLALGLSAALLVILYVDHERSYDDFHDKAERIYRMEAKTNSELWFVNLGGEHAKELKSGNYPEIEEIVQFNYREQGFVEIDNSRIPETDAYQTTVGSAFFDLFDFDFLEGNKEYALKDPNNVVLTKSAASKYFGNSSPIGKTLNYDSIDLKVTAVIADLPTHSHFSFNLLMTNSEIYGREHYHTDTYLLLNQNADVEGLKSKILDMDVAYNEFHVLTDVRLIGLQDIHLESDAAFGRGGTGDPLQINIFLALGLLVLFVAIINYINLSFALFVHKGKEVGLRKILGESTNRLISSFGLESISTTILAIPLIVLLVWLILPFFWKISGCRSL